MSGEVYYFEDPQLDRAVGLIFQLASELHVATQRIHALEALLVENGVLTSGALDTYQPDEATAEKLAKLRDGAIGRLMKVITEDGPAEFPLRDELMRAPGGDSVG